MTMGAHVAWWLPQSSKLVRPDFVGLGGFDSHTLPPLRPARATHCMAAFDRLDRHLFPRRVSSRSHALGSSLAAQAIGCVLLVLATTPAAISAQVTDTAATRPSPSLLVPRAAAAPPISPRRAFLYSLALPGTGQSILSRPTAGSVFVAAEAGTLAMIAKSANDLRAARALARDSVIFKYDTASARGPGQLPFRRLTAGALRARTRIPARRAHLEDWITILVVNHFLAGADAYVAANLWDVPTDVNIAAAPAGGMLIAARFAW